jgi:hypothetical protein
MTVASGTGAALLGGVTLAAGNVDQFAIAIDPDTSSEEIVFVTAVTSDTLTVVRGRAGTSAITHSGGAKVKHVLTGEDLTYFETNVSAGVTATSTTTLTNKTINLTSNTLTGTKAQFNTAMSDADFASLDGTETLTNKTLTAPVVNLSLNAQTGTTYTLVLADNGKLVTLSDASAITLTVPTNASVAFATGAQVNIQQLGAGQVTVAGASGVTVTGTGTKLRAQYSAATLVKTGTDSWTLIGDIA